MVTIGLEKCVTWGLRKPAPNPGTCSNCFMRKSHFAPQRPASALAKNEQMKDPASQRHCGCVKTFNPGEGQDCLFRLLSIPSVWHPVHTQKYVLSPWTANIYGAFPQGQALCVSVISPLLCSEGQGDSSRPYLGQVQSWVQTRAVWLQSPRVQTPSTVFPATLFCTL